MKKRALVFAGVKVLLLVVMILLGVYFYDKLPAIVPTHRNIHGVVDKTGSKLTSVVLFPIISFVLLILFHFLPKRDPKKKNYASFAVSWECIQIIILSFFLYMYVVILYVTLHPEVLITPFMLGGLGVLFFVLGLGMRKLKRNYFIGIKTPWTLENDEVWRKTHLFGSWVFMFAGSAFLLSMLFSTPVFSLLLGAIFLLVLLPMVYSYIVYKKIVK